MNEINTVHQAQGVPIDRLCKALLVSRATLYRKRKPDEERQRVSPPEVQGRPLSQEQQQTVRDLLHSERFVDKTPYEVFYTLLDEGEYYCSVRTMYRLLERDGESQDRREQRCHRDAIKPELIAVQQNQVWTWDITKLFSTKRSGIPGH